MTVGERAALPCAPGRGLLVFGVFLPAGMSFPPLEKRAGRRIPRGSARSGPGLGLLEGGRDGRSSSGNFSGGKKTPKSGMLGSHRPSRSSPGAGAPDPPPAARTPQPRRGFIPARSGKKGPKSRLSHPNWGCRRLCGPRGPLLPAPGAFPGDPGGMGMIPKTRPEVGAEPEPEPGDERRGFGVKTRERSAGRAAGWRAEGSGAGSGDERRRFGFSRGAGFQPARAGRAPGQGPRAAKPREKRIFRAG